MAGVITDACIKCKLMDCVEVCPVDAFYEGESMLVINPSECVDCGCCVEECPIDAIVFDTESRAEPWLDLNAKYSKLWPNVTFKNEQTPVDAAQFQNVEGKFELYFSSAAGDGDIGEPKGLGRKGGCAKCNQSNQTLPRAIVFLTIFAACFAIIIALAILIYSQFLSW